MRIATVALLRRTFGIMAFSSSSGALAAAGGASGAAENPTANSAAASPGRGHRVDLAQAAAAGELEATLLDAVLPCLRAGGVVALPTDTIYGVAAMAQNTAAVRRLYALKGRDAGKPVAICVPEVADVGRYGVVTVSQALLGLLLPGPVTVVLQRRPELNPELNPGTALVGIRVPDHAFTRQVVRGCAGALALTSANLSSHPSAVTVEEFGEIWGGLDYILDGGDLSAVQRGGGSGGGADRSGSTVVDLSVAGVYKIIRPGSAYRETVRTLRGHGLLPAGPEDKEPEEPEEPRSTQPNGCS